MPGKPKPDRLAVALEKKIVEQELAGMQLQIFKWNLKTSLLLSGKLGTIITKVIGNLRGPDPMNALLQSDISELLLEHYDSIVEVLAETVLRGNFETLEEAKAWVEELGLDEALALFLVIAKQNLRPLVAAIGRARESAKQNASSVAPPKESQPQT